MNLIEPKTKTTLDVKGTLRALEVGDSTMFPYYVSERYLATEASLTKKATGKVYKLHRAPEGILVTRIK